ncbi:MAG: PhzF family phenazine biosynthesis protein [Candidatus Methanoperedens sp.]|nr:PhzF family phenazine biosynthesis protein [Candidatus Methanoperedens sp.]
MAHRTFYILDVFAEKKYAGNQLAVVRDSEGLSAGEMQKIAREFNYSETAFILSDEERVGGYDVRIFTPKKEVPFAGHPVLGTAFVIQYEIKRIPVEEVILNLKVGQIHVKFERGGTSWMSQIPPLFGTIFKPGLIAQVLNIEAHEIDDGFPVQEVSTGLPFVIVPLKTLETLKRSKINEDAYFDMRKRTDDKAFLLFCPQMHNRENDLCVRVLADCYGVEEDPATGSANGCLAGYLVKYRYFGKDRIDIRVEQGYEIGRPSLLLLRSEEKEDHIDVNVGGSVVMIAKGELI